MSVYKHLKNNAMTLEITMDLSKISFFPNMHTVLSYTNSSVITAVCFVLVRSIWGIFPSLGCQILSKLEVDKQIQTDAYHQNEMAHIFGK